MPRVGDDLKVTFSTFQDPTGAWRYRLHLGTRLLLESGGFLFREDAESCGKHFAADPDILAYEQALCRPLPL